MKNKLSNQISQKGQDLLKDDEILSTSESSSFQEIIESRLSRRTLMKGGITLAASTFFAGALTGCADDDDDDKDSSSDNDQLTASRLNFNTIPGTSHDQLTVADGYQADVILAWGTPITGTLPAFTHDGVGGTNTSSEQAMQMGENHDGIHYFPLTGDSSDSGLLVMNHEYTNSELYPNKTRTVDGDGAPTDPDQVRKDMYAHGVSVVEVSRDAMGKVSLVENSTYNRRITLATPMELTGPVAGSDFVKTAYSNDGTMTRGTVNNCGNGFTPWGTYLTCEENIQGYFITTEDSPSRDKARMGLNANGFGYKWSNVAGDASEVDGEFARFDTTPVDSAAADGTEDYRNEANGFGYIVEIDPTAPTSTPKKRTALGRMRHEGCKHGIIEDGKQIAFYMGDDARFDYFYKFVTADVYSVSNPDSDMLDHGSLYVAKFNEDGTGQWMLINDTEAASIPLDLQAEFASQADVLVNTRSAADTLGATPMDRPEWATVNPNNGDVYVTMTNNSRREAGDENAANTRAPNYHGHVVRISETNAEAAATTFNWDIFVYGSNALAASDYNVSGLTAGNEFGSPDGIWFDDRGVLWIQTDNGAYLDSNSNDQMLAIIPDDLNGAAINSNNQTHLKRFFVGPQGCEVTGVIMTPDYKTMFVNIQHPDNFPFEDGGIARSATVVISRTDGGTIGI